MSASISRVSSGLVLRIVRFWRSSVLSCNSQVQDNNEKPMANCSAAFGGGTNEEERTIHANINATKKCCVEPAHQAGKERKKVALF